MIFEVGDIVQVRPVETYFAGATGSIAAVYPSSGTFMVELQENDKTVPRRVTLPFAASELEHIDPKEVQA